MDKYKLGKKWFWLGIFFSILFPLVGLIYGIVFLTEKNNRREAIIIVSISLLFILFFAFSYLYFSKKGVKVIPSYKIEIKGKPVHFKVGDIVPPSIFNQQLQRK